MVTIPQEMSLMQPKVYPIPYRTLQILNLTLYFFILKHEWRSGEVETVGQTVTPPPDDSSNGQPPSSSSHEAGPPAPPADQPSEGATSVDQPAPPADQPSADQPAPPADQPPHPTYSSTTLGLSEPTSDDPPSSQEDLNPLELFEL